MDWDRDPLRHHLRRVQDRDPLHHLGLVLSYECFEVCSSSWDFYLKTSLRVVIRTGQDLPNPLEDLRLLISVGMWSS